MWASCLKLIGVKKLCQNSLGVDHAPFLLNVDYGGLFYFDVVQKQIILIGVEILADFLTGVENLANFCHWVIHWGRSHWGTEPSVYSKIQIKTYFLYKKNITPYSKLTKSWENFRK